MKVSNQVVAMGDLLRDLPEGNDITVREVMESRMGGQRQLIVLDDDPTGTQSVGGLPVLMDWNSDDIGWALDTGAPAVYVMTNSRSLAPVDAEECTREVVRNATAAAAARGIEVDFVSRSDSTLRGHYPLETQTLAEELAIAGVRVDATLIVPAFPEAGRMTVNSMHYAGSKSEGYVPVGDTEFARDATFHYSSSDLRDWVEEKSEGQTPAEEVVALTLDTLRSGTRAIVDVLVGLSNNRQVVVDCVDESDLRALALGILEAEKQGKRFLFRVGPPFVRALIGQEVLEPLTAAEVQRIRVPDLEAVTEHGLIVVGSHVELTTKQLQNLHDVSDPVEVEIEVRKVLGLERTEHLQATAQAVSAGLRGNNVVLRTSRDLVKGTDADESLAIARAVSDAVVEVVRTVLATTPMKFVVAKGGITSSDVAAKGLGISRAFVRGPLLPGIVSLWEPMDGPAKGIPYVVFAGNVGDATSLSEVVTKLDTTLGKEE